MYIMNQVLVNQFYNTLTGVKQIQCCTLIHSNMSINECLVLN